MHPLLHQSAHRPWPLPRHSWTWRQSWLDLAFIHHRVDAEQVGRMLPRGVRVQEHDGSAWLAVVPFRMDGVTRRPFPSLPYLSSFPELNVRTYVEVGERPGVWFFSLDADSWPIVFGGRALYGLPYFRSRIAQRREAGWIGYHSVRRDGGAVFRCRYRPAGQVFLPERGSFEHWAAERYCLYSRTKGGIRRTEVHHGPWPLQRADVEIFESNLLDSVGLRPLEGDPRCHFSTGVDVLSYPSETLADAQASGAHPETNHQS